MNKPFPIKQPSAEKHKSRSWVVNSLIIDVFHDFPSNIGPMEADGKDTLTDFLAALTNSSILFVEVVFLSWGGGEAQPNGKGCSYNVGLCLWKEQKPNTVLPSVT